MKEVIAALLAILVGCADDRPRDPLPDAGMDAGDCGGGCDLPNATATCVAGVCVITSCDPGFDDCDGLAIGGCEASLSALPNCGACDVICDLAGAAETCATGTCTISECEAGRSDCDGDGANGCETSLGTATDCGDCAHNCGTDAVCEAGYCVPTCSAVLTDCDGACVDTEADLSHCGACGALCDYAHQGEACVRGRCDARECELGYADCNGDPTDGCETPTDTDTDCGGCGVACDPRHGSGACIDRWCRVTSCDPGYADCDLFEDNGCESTMMSLTHCGACGRRCNLVHATGSCATGACEITTCDVGFDDCNGDPYDGCETSLDTSATDCGSCGNACALGLACAGGTCSAGAVVGVEAGGDFTCALRVSGAVACWGNGERLGGSGATSTTPVGVMGLTDAVQLSAGGLFSCVVRATGNVACWGTTPGAPVTVTGIDDATRVDVGDGFHVCAVRAGGGVACWGNNDVGQLGDGTTTWSTSPVAAVGLTDATEVSAGGNYTCAVRTGGEVACWGYNQYGRLGDGTTTDRWAPTPVTGVTDAVQIATGNEHACARRASGAIVCWGANWRGALGDGTMVNSPTPVAVAGVADATDLSAGGGFTCAVRAGGAISCWGRGFLGQLGDGMGMDSTALVSVTGIADAPAVSAGGSHVCAVRTGTGGVSCWGDGAYGKIGDGMTATRYAPVSVVGLP